MKFCPECGQPLASKPAFDGRQRPTCDTCGFIFFADPKLAVAVVAERAGKVLLNRRAINPGRGKWSLPGGYVDRGEVVERAAVRELKEETNLDIKIDRLLGLYSEEGVPVVLAVYAATILGGELRPDGEVAEIGFFAPDDLPELAFPQNRQVIADWQAQRKASDERRVMPEGGRCGS